MNIFLKTAAAAVRTGAKLIQKSGKAVHSMLFNNNAAKHGTKYGVFSNFSMNRTRAGFKGTSFEKSAMSMLPAAKGIVLTGLASATTKKLARGVNNAATTWGTPGIVGYGKRGIDANNLNTDGLVQGLSRNRRS